MDASFFIYRTKVSKVFVNRQLIFEGEQNWHPGGRYGSSLNYFLRAAEISIICESGSVHTILTTNAFLIKSRSLSDSPRDIKPTFNGPRIIPFA